MPELRRRMNAEALRVRGGEHAYEEVIHRAARRRMVRRLGGAVLALAVAGGGLGLAFAAFRPAGDPRPGRPTPGPTTTPEQGVPAPILVEIRDASGHPMAGRFAALLIDSDLAGHTGGGFRTVEIISHEVRPPTTTEIQWHPPFGPEARWLKSRFFAGGRLSRLPDEIRHPTKEPVIRILVGADFARREGAHIDALVLADEFMATRQRGDEPGPYLSFFAVRDFNRRVGGLSLEGYVRGAPWRYTITAATRESDTSTVFRVRHELRDGTPIAYETITVNVPDDTAPYIRSVERNV